jgi:hypothetical protein
VEDDTDDLSSVKGSCGNSKVDVAAVRVEEGQSSAFRWLRPYRHLRLHQLRPIQARRHPCSTMTDDLSSVKGSCGNSKVDVAAVRVEEGAPSMSSGATFVLKVPLSGGFARTGTCAYTSFVRFKQGAILARDTAEDEVDDLSSVKESCGDSKVDVAAVRVEEGASGWSLESPSATRRSVPAAELELEEEIGVMPAAGNDLSSVKESCGDSKVDVAAVRVEEGAPSMSSGAIREQTFVLKVPLSGGFARTGTCAYTSFVRFKQGAITTERGELKPAAHRQLGADWSERMSQWPRGQRCR